MHPTRQQLFKLASLLMIGVVLVVGTLIIFNLNRASIYSELENLDLIPKPEKLTELYFNDNANLPGLVAKNQVISFTFVIHNLETTDYHYVYEVSVNAAKGSRRIVDSGNVLVNNNQYYVKTEKFNLKNPQGREEVVVELTNMHQSIDFWIGEN